MPREAVDSRDLTTRFEFVANVANPLIIDKSLTIELTELIETHSAFTKGYEIKSRDKNRAIRVEPYFKKNRFIPSDDYTIPLWAQRVDRVQPYTKKEEIVHLVHETALAWQGFEEAVVFRINGLTVNYHTKSRQASLCATFNGEGQRVYYNFTEALFKYIRNAGFEHDDRQISSPNLLVAQRFDPYKNNKGRHAFVEALSKNKLDKMRSKDIAVDTITLYQTFSTEGEGIERGRRNIALINCNGDIEWKYNKCPFDTRANDDLVNESVKEKAYKRFEVA